MLRRKLLKTLPAGFPMDIKRISKRKDVWEFQLIDESHGMANLIKELTWMNGGEAVYKEEHPLDGRK